MYKVKCSRCGVHLQKNISSGYCDRCNKELLSEIKLGAFWYNINELEENNDDYYYEKELEVEE